MSFARALAAFLAFTALGVGTQLATASGPIELAKLTSKSVIIAYDPATQSGLMVTVSENAGVVAADCFEQAGVVVATGEALPDPAQAGRATLSVALPEGDYTVSVASQQGSTYCTTASVTAPADPGLSVVSVTARRVVIEHAGGYKGKVQVRVRNRRTGRLAASGAPRVIYRSEDIVQEALSTPLPSGRYRVCVSAGAVAELYKASEKCVNVTVKRPAPTRRANAR
jgi:hypothetical protein